MSGVVEVDAYWRRMDELELPDPPTVPAGDVIWIAGGNFDRVNVTLRLFGDDLDPDQVSVQLGCKPTASYRKDDRLPSKRYRRIAKTGSWRLSSPEDEAGTLEEKLNRLLDSVSSDLKAWADLKQFEHDIFCGIRLDQWNRGGSLSPQLLARLAERDLTLQLDIYCIGEEETSSFGPCHNWLSVVSERCSG